MTQLPATRPELPPISSAPVPIAPDLDRILASLAAAMGSGRTLPAERALTPAVRERLSIRADVLAGWLKPCEPDMPSRGDGDLGRPGEARVMVAALLAVLPVQGSKGSVADAERIQKLYLRALGDLPRFALRAACATAMTRGLGGNRKFAPSPADLRAEAENEAHRWRVEAANVRRVLGAKLEPPRSSLEARKASAAAARISFGIPTGGFSGDRPHRVETSAPDALAKLSADIAAKTDAAMARFRAQRDEAEMPEERFAGEHAA